MGTLYHYECQHCGYTPPEDLGLGKSMLQIPTVLVHCTTCREFHLFDLHPDQKKPPRCPKRVWHQVEVLHEPSDNGVFRVKCPKCKKLNLMIEVGVWE
ncbi:hypothetical protein [Deinococcus roseus]|uniref:Zinc ribbon domain-containing protein n=1 Tax=Deinococcus roseus TaxID=392414 RepID=A0ABQ2D285_9DEIO|nr:hypothetical protein [Deinococcus roseus]GGJ42661.1 hypothetical protein GCM10008938_31000 [Deinococcus roseus]